MKPAEGYIKRHSETVSVLVRLDPEIKIEAESAAEKLDTSLTKFIEAAIRFYLDQLKREKSL